MQTFTTCFFRVRGYNYFWVPVVGPHIGAIVGAYIYKFMIGMHWPENDKESTAVDVSNKNADGLAVEQIQVNEKF